MTETLRVWRLSRTAATILGAGDRGDRLAIERRGTTGRTAIRSRDEPFYCGTQFAFHASGTEAGTRRCRERFGPVTTGNVVTAGNDAG